MTDTLSTNRSCISGRSLLRLSIVMLAVTAATLLACSLVGQVSLDTAALWRSDIWWLRVTRLTAAALVGAALATAGLALQGLLRNPLAEPYLLGISSGAGVGVLLGPVLAGAAGLAGWATTPVLAMLGALITTGVVYAIAQRRGRLDPYVLLLAGVIINVFNGAVILAILQFVEQEEMFRYIGWGMGMIRESIWSEPGLLGLCAGMVLLGFAALFARSGAMNLLGLGDESAVSGGVRVHALRAETFIVAAMMTSAAVALAGPVGFVGLIVPHIARLLLGPDHRRLTLAVGFGGAIFLMLADTLCRLLGEAFRLGELPVGVITALSGGPLFIVLLRRNARKGLG